MKPKRIERIETRGGPAGVVNPLDTGPPNMPRLHECEPRAFRSQANRPRINNHPVVIDTPFVLESPKPMELRGTLISPRSERP